MLTIGGLVFLFLCVFGSYIVSGGTLDPLLEALPFELWTIGGAAIGTCLMANSVHNLKHLGGALGKMLKGAAFNKLDYIDLLSLLFHLTKLASNKGVVAIEAHVEQPADSQIFQKFPKRNY